MEPRTKLALKYLSYGWSVIPVHVPFLKTPGIRCSCGRDDCSYPGKHPRVRWTDYTRESPSVDVVTEWFESSYYESNIGMVTGTVSGIVVVDVDGDPKHFDALGLPETLSARTGGGGSHYFYACDVPIRSLGQQTPKRRGFAEGIDLKAEGGFVVLPPSIHESGARYSWTTKVPPATLDPKLLPVRTEGNFSHNGDSTWFQELLVGVDEGGRSDAAAKLSGRYATLGLTRTETAMLMSMWNAQNRPPMPFDELLRTIRWAYDKHLASSKQLLTIADLMQELDEVEKRR